MTSEQRRQVLKAGLGATALFLPVPYAWVWAQSDGAMKLLRLPKLALVIGNGKYEDSKPLTNPVNDAQAISGSLKAAGFEVTTRLDIKREEMLSTVRAYTSMLAKRQCVGLFYFAGHGAQLAWRNYLLPVDAVIDGIEDIPKQCVDLEVLIRGVRDASNPMNIIILDACRDNPFGRDFRVNEKGLSQMDAPNSTLLAYATSPGNYASDGDGVNGLYTENLLRELKVPDAKIEDVFKRVRLHVRRTSMGQQIPWESTSLEEDFYFLPPKELREASEAEREKLFEEELALWEKVRSSTDSAPLNAFLLRYPSGRFSELAQLQLDVVLSRQGEKRVQITSSTGNPFTLGFARADLGYKTGDSYSYIEFDLQSKSQRRTFTDTVSEVREAEVLFTSGMILDRLGNTIRLFDGRRFTPRQDQPLEFAVGKKWRTRYTVTQQTGTRSDTEFEFRIVGREKVVVPAGSFDCFVIEGEGTGITDRGVFVVLGSKRWIAPEIVRRPVIVESVRKIRIQRAGAGQSAGKGPAEFAAKGPGGFAGKGPGGAAGKGPGGPAEKGPGGVIEKILNSERLELAAFKQS